MDIITEHVDGVLCITINRPARKNALTAAMYQDMADAFFDAENDPAVRVVLIRADERSLMKYFASVATLCRRAGVNELKIGLLQQDAAPTAH